MKKLFAVSALCAAVTPLTVFAEPIAIAPGSFEVPDGLQVLDRSEEINPKTGKSEGMLVFSRKGDVPRAVFIVTYLSEDAATAPSDPREAAVKIGNPFNQSLKASDAKTVSVGGVAGATYSGTLPNGLVAQSYVVSSSGYKIVVLLKGPAAEPYGPLMQSFAKAFEQFKWQPAAAAATAPAAKPAGQ